MKASWQRWVAAGLLAGGLLGVGCSNRNEGEHAGEYKTRAQVQNPPRAAGEAVQPDTEWKGQPSPEPGESSPSGMGARRRPSMFRSDVIRERMLEGPSFEGRMGAPELWLGRGLGTGLAESYDTGQSGSGQGQP